MLEVYADFAENWMAMPVIKGAKTENERFAGAVDTLCIEALMQDGKALQAGTSHFLGQNFAKAFDVQFSNKEGQLDYVWATSWGVSTRLMGALIMTHSDDEGLVLPPKLAPIHVVIVPIYKGEDQLESLAQKGNDIAAGLRKLGLTVKVDLDDTKKPGWKFAEYELKGVPVRLAIGPRDLEEGTVEVARRDTKTKETRSTEGIVEHVAALMDEIQNNLFERARNFRDASIHEVNSWEEFCAVLEEKGGFLAAHWDGTGETEDRIKEETKATIRCLPFDISDEPGVCVRTGKPSARRVLFAKAY
jgi:prolyl-tRNA synthetase